MLRLVVLFVSMERQTVTVELGLPSISDTTSAKLVSGTNPRAGRHPAVRTFLGLECTLFSFCWMMIQNSDRASTAKSATCKFAKPCNCPVFIEIMSSHATREFLLDRIYLVV